MSVIIGLLWLLVDVSDFSSLLHARSRTLAELWRIAQLGGEIADNDAEIVEDAPLRNTKTDVRFESWSEATQDVRCN